MSPGQYRKAFLPLESNPEVFNQLIHRLGVSREVAFEDVLSLEDAELLATNSRPSMALILVFPATDSYDSDSRMDDPPTAQRLTDGDAAREPVMWFKQTIHNACGLYAVLHAIGNGPASHYMQPDSQIKDLLYRCQPIDQDARASLLENDDQLAAAHWDAATTGQTLVPENERDEVDFHYVCFVKSEHDGRVYELDGDKDGPIDCGAVEDSGDMLSDGARKLVQDFVESIGEGETGFTLLSLGPKKPEEVEEEEKKGNWP